MKQKKPDGLPSDFCFMRVDFIGLLCIYIELVSVTSKVLDEILITPLIISQNRGILYLQVESILTQVRGETRDKKRILSESHDSQYVEWRGKGDHGNPQMR